jgi:hypothetical protein
MPGYRRLMRRIEDDATGTRDVLDAVGTVGRARK